MRSVLRLIVEAGLGMTLLGFISRVRAAFEMLSRNSSPAESVAAADWRETDGF